VLEARTTTAKERAAEPAVDSERVRELFEERLKTLPPAARAVERREHARLLREIGRRRALMERQTYVLSRLHTRYDASSLSRDIELSPAPPLASGVGVPLGQGVEIARGSAPASHDRIQARFIATKAWTGPVECRFPTRNRWGRPWASEVRAFRGVHLARDVTTTAGDLELLQRLLLEPVPELGLTPAAASLARAPKPAPSAAKPPAPTPGRGCSVGESSPPRPIGVVLWLALLLRVRHRIRTRSRSYCS
jgi:MYXO-CTERM domain-containing protein